MTEATDTPEAKRGRKPRTAEPSETTPMDTPEAAVAMAELQQQASAAAVLVTEQTGHELVPYSRENALIRLRGFMASASEVMLAIGRELIYIREHETADDFKALCQQAGMDARTSQRFMQAARKYAIGRTDEQVSRLAQTPRGKLLELLVLDDEEISALADGQEVAGMTLDEIDGMSTSELRLKVREEMRARENEAETSRRLLAKANETITARERELDRLIHGTPDEKAKVAAAHEAEAVQAMADATLEMLGYIQKFDQAIGALLELKTTSATEHAEQTLAFAFQRIAQISTERAMPVDFQAIVTPEWAGADALAA